MLLLGLAVGSFLNVVIARVPEGRSIWKPGSACPGCGAAIAWYDNVPLASFVALRGRCRACAMTIPLRYPLVEAATGALFVLAYALFGPTADALVACVLLAALVAITAIDVKHQIIPDVITVPGILAGALASMASGRLHWIDTVLGILAGGGVFLVIILASGGGMGGGDMKFGAMLGAFLGWKVALFSLFVAVLVGGGFAIVVLATGRKGRKDPIPFGPFLALGGTVGLFWGERVVSWYLSGFAR